ncbi:MAG: transporter substrate-binding domain-containing protein, partial [Angelakisella sp.]
IKNGLLVIVPKDSTIKTGTDLAGKTIAVQEATTADIYATKNIKDAKLLRFKSAVDAGNSVASGKADAAIIDKLPAESIVKAQSEKLALLPDMLTEEDTAMGIAKGQEDLLAVVNKVLEKAMKDGSMQTSIDKHMVEGAAG